MVLINIGVVLTMAACSSHKGVQSSPDSTSISETLSADTTVFYRKTSCKGTCPVYDFMLYSDFSCEINAKHFYRFEGRKKGKINQEDYQKLLAQIDEIKFFEMKNEYDKEYIQDLPTTYIQVKRGGERKRIKSRYEIPAELLGLQKQIEALIEGVKWE